MSRTLAPALSAVTVWAPDLTPDKRYVTWSEVDLAGLASRVGQRLGPVPDRVGWSAVVMGLASRLWSATVVPYGVSGLLPRPEALCVRDDQGAVVLGIRDQTGVPGGLEALGDLVLSLLAPVVAAAPLSDRLLWANVAASLAAVPRVHERTDSIEAVTALLNRAPLAGELLVTGTGMVRRKDTCCLFYLVPGAGLCGDCALDRVPSRSAP